MLGVFDRCQMGKVVHFFRIPRFLGRADSVSGLGRNACADPGTNVGPAIFLVGSPWQGFPYFFFLGVGEAVLGWPRNSP